MQEENCESVREEGKNSKSVWWNGKLKSVFRKKEAAWKEVLATNNDEAKERCMESYREEKKEVKRCIYQSKKKVNEHFGRKMNMNVNGNIKLFWKEVSYVKGGKVESCSRIKDINWRLAQRKQK